MQAAYTCARQRHTRNGKAKWTLQRLQHAYPPKSHPVEDHGSEVATARREMWLGFGAQQCHRKHADLDGHDITANVVSLDAKSWHCASMPLPKCASLHRVPGCRGQRASQTASPGRRRSAMHALGAGPHALWLRLARNLALPKALRAHAELRGPSPRGQYLM